MIRKLFQLAIPFIWFGMVAAISFMEAPLKFQAPGITIPLGLEIGRLVFTALNWIEIVLGVILLVAMLSGREFVGRVAWTLFGLVVVILIAETFWLLPVLDARAVQVITGTAEPFSKLHFFYIGFDAVKLVLLFALGTVMVKRHVR
jgi:hypothetical protein